MSPVGPLRGKTEPGRQSGLAPLHLNTMMMYAANHSWQYCNCCKQPRFRKRSSDGHCWSAYHHRPFAKTSHLMPKPTWEFPRLCRGGSKSLTYPAVDAARSIAATRRAAKHTKGIVSMVGLKPDAPHRGAVMQALPPEQGSQARHIRLRHSSVEEGQPR